MVCESVLSNVLLIDCIDCWLFAMALATILLMNDFSISIWIWGIELVAIVSFTTNSVFFDMM